VRWGSMRVTIVLVYVVVAGELAGSETEVYTLNGAESRLQQDDTAPPTHPGPILYRPKCSWGLQPAPTPCHHPVVGYIPTTHWLPPSVGTSTMHWIRISR
jgi:hypothetical protein